MMLRFSSSRLRFPILLLLFGIHACAPAQQQERPIAIVPKPVEILAGQGTFRLTKSTTLVSPKGNDRLVEYARWFAKSVKYATGFTLSHQQGSRSVTGSIFLDLDETRGNEAYTLTMSTDRVEIRGGRSGVFYGLQTLLQLFPPEIASFLRQSDVQWEAPCVTIRDTPRFSWRGMHLDVSRHFFSKEIVKSYIDMLAMHKMNVFHWHLCDDQGWRIEIRKYPKLTQVGAWRVDRESEEWNARRPQQPDERATYGGFYTQNDIREVIAYAAERCVTVVPEIEMPAHCTAALAAYPEYSCAGGPFTVPPGGIWPLSDIYCAGNDGTFEFLQNILDEVCELFPSGFIHIGGDEADKTRWKACAKCQARIRTEHLRDEDQLQSYFIARIEKHLRSRNRRLIGWDEIIEGGLAPNATVMSWRGMDGGIAAAKMNHDVVMTPGTHCYFDYYQGRTEHEPRAIGGYTPLSKVYAFEPVPPELTPEQAGHILGAQGNVWTEYIATPQHVQYMTLPRMAALAEVVWSPKGSRNWDDFARRIDALCDRYEVRNDNFAKSAWMVTFTPRLDTVSRTVHISLNTEMPVDAIHFTTDHSDPTTSSPEYTSPLTVTETIPYRAVAFMHGKRRGKETEKTFYIHKALLKQPGLEHPYQKYTAGGPYGLVDGITGSISFNDGCWQGFSGNDLDATIDLGVSQRLASLETHFLENTISWIFLPRSVDISVSDDGASFTLIATIDLPVPKEHQPVRIRNVKYDFKDVTTRFVRLTARSIGRCPDWHAGKGKAPWLFADEIIIQ